MPTLALRALGAALLLSATAAACAADQVVTLPLKEAWFEGEIVHYVSTDISDPGIAKKQGINYVPALADTLKPGMPVEKAYKFPGDEQATVLPSIPRPLGGANADASYSPLWVLVMVRWKPGITLHTLKSEEAVLAAEEKGEVELTRTRIVANWPVVRARGAALQGVR
ncbi:hypothetical protein J2X20_001329 [Pelomonas saccharophila]|uniref:DUF7482 domain-containing protein n=1 Tax=Roseateles saccharophilus TaxID=304 RepID=A0ABU1YKH7_ROSSA|nr:hypothetical protein [Roseateles saccharophilus]MDR7268700.1 hypothetical protein [Roseateles saccharophilus]